MVVNVCAYDDSSWGFKHQHDGYQWPIDDGSSWNFKPQHNGWECLSRQLF